MVDAELVVHDREILSTVFVQAERFWFSVLFVVYVPVGKQ